MLKLIKDVFSHLGKIKVLLAILVISLGGLSIHLALSKSSLEVNYVRAQEQLNSLKAEKERNEQVLSEIVKLEAKRDILAQEASKRNLEADKIREELLNEEVLNMSDDDFVRLFNDRCSHKKGTLCPSYHK